MNQDRSFATNRITVNLEELRSLTLAQALEESREADRAIGEDASLKASHRLGENPDLKSYLLERSKILVNACPVSFSVSGKHKFALPFAISLMFAVFLAGAFTERIGALDHSLNLLSLPFFGLMAWNFICYVVLALVAVGLLKESRFSLRHALTVIIEKAHFSSWRTTDTHSLYLRHLYENLTPYFRLCVVKYLHIAAAIFALGLIAGMLIRGLSTSYWAVWESTWFYDDPQSVKWILDHTYGLIPGVAGLPSMPDLETVSQMQLENAAYVKTGFSAAPWMIRSTALLVAFVVIPRFLLFLFNHLKSKAALGKIAFPVTNAYVQNALKEGSVGRMTGGIFFLIHHHGNDDREKLTSIANAWGNSESETEALYSLDFSLQTPKLPDRFPKDKSHLLMIVFSAKDTPEDDLHGNFLDTALAAYGKNANIRVAAFLDTRSLQAQYKNFPQRVSERGDLWKHFFDAHRIPCYVLRNSTDTPKTAAHDIRSWANQTFQKAL